MNKFTVILGIPPVKKIEVDSGNETFTLHKKTLCSLDSNLKPKFKLGLFGVGDSVYVKHKGKIILVTIIQKGRDT